MRVIRSGVTRTVVLVGRYAVKVPSLRGGSTGQGLRGRLGSFAQGLLANQSEHTWHTYGPWAGQVAPVLASWLGGIVQVYPRCTPLAAGDRGPLFQLDPDPGDLKPDNFGRLGRRVVRVDYEMK